MDWVGNKGFLVDLISYASIVSAAIFGMIGLFTEYKKDGRITLWGRLAAGGIAMSAAFAMASAVLQKQISSEAQADGERRAREQRAIEQAQFETQLGELTGLSRQMAGVNAANATIMTDMRRSLGAQQAQLASARRNLLLTTGLRAQGQENTVRLLETMWTDANRVPVGGITLDVVVDCLTRGDEQIAHILGQDAGAQIVVAPLESAHRLVPEFNLFANYTLLGSKRELDGEASRIGAPASRVSLGKGQGSVSEWLHFSGFRTAEPWYFADPDAWRRTAIEILVSGGDAAWAAELARRLPEPPQYYFTMEGSYVLSDWKHGGRPVPYPCNATAKVMVNERVAAEAGGLLVRVENPPLPTRIVLKFPIVTVDPALFPTFVAAGSTDGATPGAPR